MNASGNIISICIRITENSIVHGFNILLFKINGNLTNTRNDITLYVESGLVLQLNVSAGPLQYLYHLHEIKVHFGQDDSRGSEHTINSLSFPAEVRYSLLYNIYKLI